MAGSLLLAPGMIDKLHKVQLQWVTEPAEPERRVSRAASHGDTVEVYRDAELRIVSDRSVTRAQARALAARIEAAYDWDAAKLGWSRAAPLRPRLNVAVLTEDAFARFTGDSTGTVAGVTTGPDLFVVPERVLGRMSRDDVDTVAHELTHVQDFREAGRRVDGIPTYLLEGRAYVDGNRFAGDAAKFRDVLEQLSARDAAAVLSGFRHARDEQKDPRFVFVAEVTGGLFVEFLRKKLGGRGKADAMKRLSRCVEALGRGTSFEAAFRAQFGVTLGAAEQQFLRWVRATEGRPSARLSGTLYAR